MRAIRRVAKAAKARRPGVRRDPVAPNASAPTLSSAPIVGSPVSVTLSENYGGTQPISVTRVYVVDDVEVATGESFIPTSGAVMKPRVVLTNAAGAITVTGAGQAISGTGAQPNPAAPTAAPALTGSPVLRASWDFDNAGTLSLTGSDINSVSGADGTTYTLTSSGTERPKLVTLAGRGAARFQAAQLLKIASDLGLDASALTLVVVGEMSVNTTDGTFMNLGGTTSSYYNSSRLRASSQKNGFAHHRGDNSGLDGIAAGALYPLGRHLLVGVSGADATELRLYVDNAGTVTTKATTGVNSNRSAFQLGAAGTARGDALNGYIWRALVYVGELTATNVGEIASWALAAWGVGGAASSVAGADMLWEDPSDMTGITGWRVFASPTLGGSTVSADVALGTKSHTFSGLGSGDQFFSLASLAGTVEGPRVYAGSKKVA